MASTQLLEQRNEPTRRERPPIAVFVAIASLIGGGVWVAAFTPAVNPTLTVELPSSWPGIIFQAALVVGTVLGIRLAWDFFWFFAIMAAAFIFLQAIYEPTAQTIGGTFFITLGAVLLVSPSVRRYETKKLRLVIEERWDDPPL